MVGFGEQPVVVWLPARQGTLNTNIGTSLSRIGEKGGQFPSRGAADGTLPRSTAISRANALALFLGRRRLLFLPRRFNLRKGRISA